MVQVSVVAMKVMEDITISGGNITAQGAIYGAGIGGGWKGNGGTITISGGTVDATGGDYGAGIGGGEYGNGGIITITDGDISTTGGKYGAGIGSGDVDGAPDPFDGGTITISGGTVKTTGGESGGAGIGGGRYADGGIVTITGGTVIANGNETDGIGKGDNGSNAGSCYISGGVVNAGSMGPDVYSDNSESTQVYLTTATLEDVSEITKVIALTTTVSSYTYNITDSYTDESGKIYLWLPVDTNTTGAQTEKKDYIGLVTTTADGTATGMLSEPDTEKPTVIDVTPNRTGAAISGDIEITFSEEMDTSTGVVSLDGGSTYLAGGSWSDGNSVYRTPYSVELYNTEYTITISDFSDIVGNEMEEDSSYTFTTVESYTVTFDAQGGSEVDPIVGITYGSTITEPGEPAYSGYTFGGWYTNTDFSIAWDFDSDTVTADTILYAKWTKKSSDNSDSSDVDEKIVVTGNSQDVGASKESINSQGQTLTTISVDTDKLQTILDSQDSGATVIVSGTSQSDIVEVVLTGEMLDNMKDKEATLIVKNDTSTYILPVSEINIDADVNLSDVKTTIHIGEPSKEMVQVIESAGEDGGFTIMIPGVSYTISYEYNERTVEVRHFNSYVERLIAIPDAVDPEKITTGVVVRPDGTVYHVPTQIVIIDGVYYAKINSLTNSAYVVVRYAVAFDDVESHWAQDAINNMGSRMIVNGNKNGNYYPDNEMTRGEFATIIVRALGLESGEDKSNFNDVNTSDWYYKYIDTAVSYGIIEGYNETTFGPDDTITRKQAMTMIGRAMKITGLTAADTSKEVLMKFVDAYHISSYALEGVEACIANGLVSGRDEETIAPQERITRAEVAVIIQRLLQQSGLIE